MRRLGRMTQVSLQVATLLAVCWSGGVAVSAHAAEPDYSDVDDILNGERTLMAIQDLAVVATVPTSPGHSLLRSTTLTTNNSQVTSDILGQNFNMNGTPRFQSFAGHMFNRPHAVTLHVNDQGFIYMPDPSRWFQLPIGLGDFQGAVADFNRDGYDDLFLANDHGRLFVAVAADVNSPGAGFRYGPVGTSQGFPARIATGDFNGDGQPEIAVLRLFGGSIGRFRSFCVEIWTVDPKTLALHWADRICLEAGNELRSIASGRFTTSSHDQLVVAYAADGSPTVLKVLDFAPGSLQPQEKSTLQTASYPHSDGIIRVKTGKFNYPSELDQIVFLFGWRGSRDPGQGTKYLDLMTVDPDTLAITSRFNTRGDFSSVECVYDIAVGNFDHRQPDPVHQGQTEHNPNQQVALLYGHCGNDSKAVTIFNVDPTNFTWSQGPGHYLPATFNGASSLAFVAADTQGRSYVLGAPTKVVLENNAQPTAVIAMPPMHVDFIPPAGEEQPTVLNVSAIPDGFNAAYDTKDTSSNQSTSATSTS